MGTLKQAVDRVVAAKTAIGNAITAKGGTVAAGDGLEEFAADIETIPSGGGSVAEKAVNFYDYDGTVVASYTATEFAELTAMPANPTHEGLTAQGWNWSLSDAKSYVGIYGKLDVGQMYITSDGTTRVHINLIDNYTSPTLELYLKANSEVDVDWGDGSTHSTFTSTTANFVNELHSYSTSGDYTIIISVISGSIIPKGNDTPLLKGSDTETNRIYRESLYNIEIGNSITSIDAYAFQSCSSLTSITIPNSITSIGVNTFDSCYSLKSITIPNSITSIGVNTFDSCYSLKSITIPNSVTSIRANAFENCYLLTSITIPNPITNIDINAFYNCFSLTSITIPNSVTNIGGYAFYNCSSLTSITIPNSVTSIGNTTFQNCYSLLNIYIMDSTIPAGSPWSAPNSHINVVATRHNNYQTSSTEVVSGTTLTGTVNATVGDLVVATFVIRGNTYTIDSGWTFLGIGDNGAINQRTAMAYKIATSSSESLTVTQDTAGRIYINLVSITGASVGTFSGFTTQATGSSITLPKPSGLVIWGVSSAYWGTQSPYQLWGIPGKDNVTAIQLPNTTQPRCLTALDQSTNASETFIYSPDTSGDAGLAAASLTISGIDNFWYYDELT